MTVLVIGEALRVIGLPGWAVLIATAGVTLYHGRSIMQALSTLGFVTRILGVVAFGLVVIATGIIPGLDLDVAVGPLVEFVMSIVDLLWSMTEAIV